MLAQFYYPIICTDHYVKTVNFYEDHFDFQPDFELAGFVIMKHRTDDNMYLAIIDRNHKAIPDKFKKPVSGMILNYPVKDVRAAYQQFYWEGLSIISEPEIAPCARKHFFVEDPNGILIDIAEHVSKNGTDNIKNHLANLCCANA